MLYKERLKTLRENSEMTQKKLGEIISVDRKVFNHFESEYTIMPIKHLVTICNYFHVSLDYIFGFTDYEYLTTVYDIDVATSGHRLKEMRKELGLTQDALASFLNVNRTTITKYEKGINIIATPFLYTICKKYNISADYLLGKTDEPKYLKKC